MTLVVSFEEVGGHQGVEGVAVAAFGPGPIEVAGRFETADMSGFEPAFHAAAGALLLRPVEQCFDPSAGDGFHPVRQEAMQIQRLGTRVQSSEVTHLFDP